MEKDMNYGSDYKYIPMTSVQSGEGVEVLPDVYMYTIQIVNIVFYGDPRTGEFVLIDAGMPNSASKILKVAEDRFGANAKPKAIILTHGHFDHVGAIIELIEKWNVPVYAHPLEIPYLTGTSNYPEPDPTAGGGLITKMSSFFPNHAINLGNHVKELPKDGTVPFMEGFRWIHTPGHTPGHISLFRDADGTLIAGDAFVSVKQESLYNVLSQEKEISGPPRYFTLDWADAWDSIKTLEALNAGKVITGHGLLTSGEELTNNLQKLAKQFKDIIFTSKKFLN